MSESSDWKCIVLDKQSYKQAMIEYAGMTPEEANKEVEEHFSKWHNLNAKNNDYQSVMFSRFKHPGSLTQYEVRFGFIAVMTTGSTPLFVSINNVFANASQSGNYTFDEGAKSAVITNNTTVKMNYDGYVIVAVQNGYAVGSSISVGQLINTGFEYSYSMSNTQYYRYYIYCYDTVHPSWMS